MGQDGDQDEGKDDESVEVMVNGKPPHDQVRSNNDVSEEEEEEEEEPRLKYANVTRSLGPVYRNGDATSTFMVAGDKMVIGTHNGYIHVHSVPDLKPIRSFHAHQASITAVSISPCPPPLSHNKRDSTSQKAFDHQTSPTRSPAKSDKGTPVKNTSTPVPNTPSNNIFVSSASIDGNVFISSLTDSRDVQLRNFGRPIKAIGLSPEYKSNRSYLSGGLAGSLVLTVGGQIGTKSNATTSGAPASSWLGSIGLSANHGKDEVLHSGEGAISTIRWSLSGKYVAWVNEKGIKLMRSDLHLESGESDFAWKRMSHIDHPNRPGWDEMAGIWKAHLHWIDEAGLESDDFYENATVTDASDSADIQRRRLVQQSRTVEKLVVGWSGTIWVINVQPGDQAVANTSKTRKPAKVEIVTILRMDCTISGLSLYTPSLLVVLAFLTPDEDLSSTQTPAKKGLTRRQNSLQPEIRVIDIITKEEVNVADTLSVNRFESLSATDYHLDVLPAIRVPKRTSSDRGTLEAIGGGIGAIGGGIWDATMYPARYLTSAASVRTGDSPSSSKAPSIANVATDPQPSRHEAFHLSALNHGIKIFIQSPYDCIIATKPTLADHITWLDSHSRYEEAWKLLQLHPSATPDSLDDVPASTPSTPTQTSLNEWLADDSSQVSHLEKASHQKAQRVKLLVGERWIQQLVSAEEWDKAGKACGQVLTTSSKWDYWVNVFADAGKFDEITDLLPGDEASRLLTPKVYERFLSHYLSTDRLKFSELLERWPPETYNVNVILEEIQARFKSGEVSESSVEDGISGRDWHLLMTSLAKLFLSVGRPRKALRCYIQLQDADAAMSLISSAHLVSAVADDISGFVLLRVSKEQRKSAEIPELASLTLEPIRLLVSEAHYGTVSPENVIAQLRSRLGMPNPYLFFYFRALWQGDTAAGQDTKSSASRKQPMSERLLATEGRTIVSDYGDTALTLFAEYDRELLMTFLKASQSYTLSLASQLCEQRHYVPELVYLLSKEGRTAQALRLIIDQIGDVSQAIAFAKDQNDSSLWDDLLEYSMSKPVFIRGLLEQVGTAIDPLKLVKRIPQGVEIEGLKEGLGKMLRDFEVQESIVKGVARVMRGEVNAAMQERSTGRRKAIRFDVAKTAGRKQRTHEERKAASGKVKMKDLKPGHCAGCGDALNDQDHPATYLLAFPCTHTFHLPCLLSHAFPAGTALPSFLNQFTGSTSLSAEEMLEAPMETSTGPKVDRARLLGTVLEKGCPLEVVGPDDGEGG